MDKAPKQFDEEAHHALASKAAAHSIVLLKNEDGLLPLAEGTRVAVIGDFAKTPRYQGAGSSMVNSTRVDALLDCLQDSGLEVVGYAQGFERHGQPNEQMKINASILAKRADIVLLCLGLDEIQESEGLDRQNMKLAQNQVELLNFVAAANPNIAVVFSAGSVVEMPWLNQCRALVYGALGGQAGAGAMADVLTGKVNPGGKLAETWPLRYKDAPSARNFGGAGRTVEYREGLYVGYRYYQTAGVPVQFPFGYGLSYTTFAYSDLIADANGATLTVKNTGKMAGAEIVQLYIAKPNSQVFRPAQELKGFTRVFLQAGESKRITIPLDDKAFRFWNTASGRWEVEGGQYKLLVGASVQDIRLQAVATVRGTATVAPYDGLELPAYHSGKVQKVSDAEFEALLGRPILSAKPAIDRNLTFSEMRYGRSPLGWLVCTVMTVLLDKSLKAGKPDLNILFIYNMPLRALAKMTGGMVSMGMVDGLAWELKGLWVIGLLRVLFEFVKNLLQNAAWEKSLKR